MAWECHTCDVTSAGWERGSVGKKGAWAFVFNFQLFLWCTSAKYFADKTITVSHMCRAYLSAMPEPSEGPLKVDIYHASHKQRVAKNT